MQLSFIINNIALLVFYTRDKLLKKEKDKYIEYEKNKIYKQNCLVHIQAYNLLKIRRKLKEKRYKYKIR